MNKAIEMVSGDRQAFYKKIVDGVGEAGVFDGVEVEPGSLYCKAKHVESETTYRVTISEDEGVWIGLYTPDRWLSESIEAELMHQGDKLEELLEEELFDQGFESSLPVEHFRDESKQYVFRSRLPAGDADDHDALADQITRVLLAYEAAFRPLGDMSPSDDLG